MIIYKNKTLANVDTSQVSVGEIIITQSKSQTDSKQNFTVYFHRISSVFKPLGDFPNLMSAISFGESFENQTIMKDGYQIIKLGSLDEIIIYYPQYTEYVHSFAKKTGREKVGHATQLEGHSIIVEFYTKNPTVKAEVTAVDESDLVSFGLYVLSLEREDRLKSNDNTNIPYEDRFRDVHHADIENWKHNNSKK